MVPVLWKARRRPVVNWKGYSSSGISTGPSWSTGVKGARFSTSSALRWACRNLVPTWGFSTTSVVSAWPSAFSAPLVLAANCSLGVGFPPPPPPARASPAWWPPPPGPPRPPPLAVDDRALGLGPARRRGQY